MRSFSSIALFALSFLLLVSSTVGQCEVCGDGKLEVTAPDAVVFRGLGDGICDPDALDFPELLCFGLDQVFGPISSVTCADLEAVDSDIIDDICPAIRALAFDTCGCDIITDGGFSLFTLLGLIAEFFTTLFGS